LDELLEVRLEEAEESVDSLEIVKVLKALRVVARHHDLAAVCFNVDLGNEHGGIDRAIEVKAFADGHDQELKCQLALAELGILIVNGFTSLW